MKAPDYATVPCKGCGRPVIFVTAFRADGTTTTVPLDPSAPIYAREPDGEGGGVWSRVDPKTAPIFVSHFATCSNANQFSGTGRREG